jgi:D-glycero-D-manno-heptose 1,7-bisphosphate phosphatase
MTRAVFWLDRDGTVVDDPGYLDDPARLVLLPGAARGVSRLNRLGTVVLVTNQSGIGRGYVSAATVDAIHRALVAELALEGGRLDGIEVCPHAPDAGCDCRKPAPGLVTRGRRALGPFDHEFVLGDKRADLELARAVGAISILVRTGEGRNTEHELVRTGELDGLCDHVFDDLDAAATWLATREDLQ